MKKIIINGQKKLEGTIRISGAKNAAVAIIPAAILTDEEANSKSTIYIIITVSYSFTS